MIKHRIRTCCLNDGDTYSVGYMIRVVIKVHWVHAHKSNHNKNWDALQINGYMYNVPGDLDVNATVLEKAPNLSLYCTFTRK